MSHIKKKKKKTSLQEFVFCFGSAEERAMCEELVPRARPALTLIFQSIQEAQNPAAKTNPSC
jgi:hypothetical protein